MFRPYVYVLILIWGLILVKLQVVGSFLVMRAGVRKIH